MPRGQRQLAQVAAVPGTAMGSRCVTRAHRQQPSSMLKVIWGGDPRLEPCGLSIYSQIGVRASGCRIWLDTSA